MTAELKDGKLIITVDFDKTGTVSSTGKSRLHASVSKDTEVQVNGKPVKVSLNAYTKI